MKTAIFHFAFTAELKPITAFIYDFRYIAVVSQEQIEAIGPLLFYVTSLGVMGSKGTVPNKNSMMTICPRSLPK